MEIIESIEELASASAARGPAALTIGVFDGLHTGHQALIRRTVEQARARSCAALVITFAAHPLSVLAPPYCPRQLIYPARKEQLLRAMGVDVMARLPFTADFSQLTPLDFAGRILADACAAKVVVCGYDFSFGKSGEGNCEMLARLGESFRFDVDEMDPVTDSEGVFVKSTMVRDLLYSGEVLRANTLLALPFELQGRVAKGYGRGNKIGFPTANLQVTTDHVIPARGVYLAFAMTHQPSGIHGAMVNIGYNPTFGRDRLSIEAHLLDFEGELGSRTVSLFFLRRMRDERKFESVEALTKQLNADRESSRRMLAADDMTALSARLKSLL
ncbi:MAG: bifunctional riboflavin kinase/FAD synthetase [bacterium]